MEKKYQLPKEFGEKWVYALRSGEYNKTVGDMYGPELMDKKECFCGNGIGLLVNGIPRKELIMHSYVDRDLYKSHPEIPIALVDHFGKNNEWTLFDQIAQLNDVRDYTFEQQADWIESNVEFI